jgi:hypothetical protein
MVAVPASSTSKYTFVNFMLFKILDPCLIACTAWQEPGTEYRKIIA